MPAHIIKNDLPPACEFQTAPHRYIWDDKTPEPATLREARENAVLCIKRTKAHGAFKMTPQAKRAAASSWHDHKNNHSLACNVYLCPVLRPDWGSANVGLRSSMDRASAW